MALGQGRLAPDILAERQGVTEGAESAPAVVELARRLGVDMPICETVERMIDGRLALSEAIAELINRPFREEA